VRRQREQLKRDLKASRCAIEEVLSDPPAFVLTAKVADLLLAQPKYGPVKVNKLLSHCGIAPAKTIGGLSERQRNELAAVLAGLTADAAGAAPTTGRSKSRLQAR
jgi:hypothetical protein